MVSYVVDVIGENVLLITAGAIGKVWWFEFLKCVAYYLFSLIYISPLIALGNFDFMTLGPDSDAHSRFRVGYMKFHRSQEERARTDLKRPNVKTTFCLNYSGGTSDFSGSVLQNIFQHFENRTGKTKRDCTRFSYACPCLCTLPCPCSSKKSSRQLYHLFLGWRH